MSSDVEICICLCSINLLFWNDTFYDSERLNGMCDIVCQYNKITIDPIYYDGKLSNLMLTEIIMKLFYKYAMSQFNLSA